MRAFAPAVAAALLLAACARDLELPAEEEARPEFLGELSGFYGLSYPLEVPGLAVPVEVPLGSRLHLAHVANEEQPADAVVGVVEHASSLATLSDLVPAGCTSLLESNSIDILYGLNDRTVTPPTVGASVGDLGGLLARPGVTEGALVLDYQPCAEAPACRLHAFRQCGFETSVSGVFPGRGGRGPAAVGLGVYPPSTSGVPLLVGLEWPGGTVESFQSQGRIFFGLFDPTTGSASAVVGDLATQGYHCADLALSGDDRRLSTQIEISPEPAASLEACLAGGGAGAGSDRFTGTRLSGARAESCQPPPAVGLTLFTSVDDCGGERFLDVFVLAYDGGEPRVLDVATAPSLGLGYQVVATDAGGGTAAAVAAPAGVSMRYGLAAAVGPIVVAADAQRLDPASPTPFESSLPACVHLP